MTNRNIKEFDPLRGRMNPKILIVLSTGWGSTSLTQQPAAIQRLDPFRGQKLEKYQFGIKTTKWSNLSIALGET